MNAPFQTTPDFLLHRGPKSINLSRPRFRHYPHNSSTTQQDSTHTSQHLDKSFDIPAGSRTPARPRRLPLLENKITSSHQPKSPVESSLAFPSGSAETLKVPRPQCIYRLRKDIRVKLRIPRPKLSPIRTYKPPRYATMKETAKHIVVEQNVQEIRGKGCK